MRERERERTLVGCSGSVPTLYGRDEGRHQCRLEVALCNGIYADVRNLCWRHHIVVGHAACKADELTVKKGDLILVIKFEDPTGIPGDCDWVSVVQYTKRGKIPANNLSKIAPQPEDTSFMWLPKGFGDSSDEEEEEEEDEDGEGHGDFSTTAHARRVAAAPPTYSNQQDDAEDEVLGGFASPGRATKGAAAAAAAAAAGSNVVTTSTPVRPPTVAVVIDAADDEEDEDEEDGGGFGNLITSTPDDGGGGGDDDDDDEDEEAMGFGRVTQLDVSTVAADTLLRSNSVRHIQLALLFLGCLFGWCFFFFLGGVDYRGA